jgi:peptidoglycan hydrolase-like protein with peptidoglycan-binding domain
MLQQGSRGSAVAALQKKLGINADGIFGPQTAAAVRSYQAKHGLHVDGIVGPATSAKLGLGGGGGGGGTKSTTSGGSSSATMKQFAEDYGYQLAFLKSDKELYGIFQNAVNHKWDATRFVAAVKASKWYKAHGEAYRQNLALKTTDPATYKQRLGSQIADVGNMATGMGATLSAAQLSKVAEDSVLFGWNENQIRNTLGAYIKAGTGMGQAGVTAAKLKETAYRNGATIPQSSIDYWVKQIAMGKDTVEAVQQRYRDSYGAQLAPGFAKELKSGMDLYDVASPFMQTMAQTLELNPSDVDLFDPTIRKALGGTPDKSGKPVAPTMWQFEQTLRQDGRYMKTKQAQDQTMAVGNKVLQDMGLIGG